MDTTIQEEGRACATHWINVRMIRQMAFNLLKRLPTKISIRKKCVCTSWFLCTSTVPYTIMLDRTQYDRG